MICCLSTQTTHYTRRQKLSQNSSQSVSRAVMKLCLVNHPQESVIILQPFKEHLICFYLSFCLWLCICGCVWLWEASECFVFQQHHVIISVICLFHVLSFLRVFLARNADLFVPLLTSFLYLWHSTIHKCHHPNLPCFSCGFPQFQKLPLILASFKSHSRFPKETWEVGPEDPLKHFP